MPAANAAGRRAASIPERASRRSGLSRKAATRQVAPRQSIESHREVTNVLTSAYSPMRPGVKRSVLWKRVRISVELGYAVDEMLNEEDRVPRDEMFREAARQLRAVSLGEPD